MSRALVRMKRNESRKAPSRMRPARADWVSRKSPPPSNFRMISAMGMGRT
jgi:hypothetical protein